MLNVKYDNNRVWLVVALLYTKPNEIHLHGIHSQFNCIQVEVIRIEWEFISFMIYFLHFDYTIAILLHGVTFPLYYMYNF